MSEEELIVAIFSMVLVAGSALAVIGMWHWRRVRELEHRERLAMIERGLIPSPEVNPAAFERLAGLRPAASTQGGRRFRTGGVLLMGFGLALATLLTLAAGAPAAGLGVGGAFLAMGAAFYYNGFLADRLAVSQNPTSQAGLMTERAEEPYRPEPYPPGSGGAGEQRN